MKQLFTVTLPDIGEGVVEGEVIEWLKQVGDSLAQDEPVVIVMTDKATVELPSPYPGKLTRHHYPVGGIALYNEPLYEIEVEGEFIQSLPSKEKEKKTEKREKNKKEERGLCASTPRMHGEKALAVPAVRRLAKELQIDLHAIPGTGTEGRITAEDVRAFYTAGARKRSAKEKKCAAPDITVSTPLPKLEGDVKELLVGLRKLTAERMVESKYIIPHFSYFDQADATRLGKFRTNIKKEAFDHGIALTFMPFFIRALSLVLREYPQLNSSVELESNSLVIHKIQNIGIAMDTPLGLMVPVLKEVEKMSFHEIIQNFEALKKRAQAGELVSKDMKDATITMSNFGTLGKGGFWATPIISYPNIAILGVAKIRKQPIERRGAIVLRDLLPCSWSFDHRVIDGGVAARVSASFVEKIEHPIALL